MAQQSRYITTRRVIQLIEQALADFQAGGSGITEHCLYITVTNQQALDKAVTLSHLPRTPNAVRLDILNGGGAAKYDADFIVNGQVLSWGGRGLDSVLEEGDELRIFFIS